MKLFIDGLKIKSENDFHDVVGRELYVSEWYGKNLHALWDVLTGMTDRPLTIVWKNSEKSRESMKGYCDIINMLRSVEEWDKKIGRKDCFYLILE